MSEYDLRHSWIINQGVELLRMQKIQIEICVIIFSKQLWLVASAVCVNGKCLLFK